ncbi:type II toxin-antitoxin system HicB family antitoxin [Lentilactobacillus parakefiri]|nr:type II toxin-antitoxin system HicB family antitoxin [Lentilactobacillus parakefiri]KRL72000.1 putative phage protein [Lentilactobacillus parakefiri DSM 10551]PAK85085.1 HicB family protein [Lentilactobacillus parakefiri]PAL01025.1 HicB family protein [Lentilactobacillus parakefiri]
MKNPDYVVYPAIFDHIDNDGYYTVTFPDIPDTVSQGHSLADAMKEAPDAIAVALPDYAIYPTPSDVKKVQAEHSKAIVSLVGVNMKEKLKQMKKRTVHKNVTIPVALADAAKEQGINFSEVLTEALEEKIHA